MINFLLKAGIIDLRAGVGHQPKAMEDYTATRGARAQGAGGVHSASWGNPRVGGQAGGRLKPEVKVTLGGDRPPRLDGDVVTFEDMREFLIAYSKYKQQMHITNLDGGDRVIARRRELVHSATQMMVADDFYVFFFFFSHTSTFQLLDKPWSQVSSLSPPRFLPSIFIAHRVQQSHCSSIFHRVLLTHALALSASQFVHKKKSQRIYTSMHSAGLELTKPTYTRLEDNLIRHRGDR